MPPCSMVRGAVLRLVLVALTGVAAALLTVVPAVVAQVPAAAFCDSIAAGAPAPPELAMAQPTAPASGAVAEDATPSVPEVAVEPITAPATWTETGEASWYGPYFHGRRTASGERFDASARTIAHPTLPFGAIVAIENVANGRSSLARVNDRGPFVAGRILDCSYRLAHELGFVATGVASVRVTWIDSGPAEDFAGNGTLVALCEEDRAPLARFAAAFTSGSRRSREFVGPPAPPEAPAVLALAASDSPADDEAVEVRRASVASFSAVLHAGRHLLRAVLGDYADAPVDLGFDARLEAFGLRAFVALFSR